MRSPSRRARVPAPRRSKTDWPAELAWQCKAVGLPEPVREFRFHQTRKWRFDLSWPEQGVAVEVDGGAFVGGRHTRGAGYRADCEKLNHAVMAGWRVLRVLPEWVQSGLALDYVIGSLRKVA